jgi:hypothetical protein
MATSRKRMLAKLIGTDVIILIIDKILTDINGKYDNLGGESCHGESPH